MAFLGNINPILPRNALQKSKNLWTGVLNHQKSSKTHGLLITEPPLTPEGLSVYLVYPRLSCRIQEITSHPYFQLACKVVSEVVKIFATTILIEGISSYFLKTKIKTRKLQIYLDTVVKPLGEEIYFRGFLQRGIYLLQYCCNHLKGKDLSEKEERVQKHLRIHLTTLIFAATHVFFMNAAKPLDLIIQFTWSYIGGVSYGYLSEKTHSLSLNILAHALNNILFTAGLLYPAYAYPILLALIINRLFFLTLGMTSLIY